MLRKIWKERAVVARMALADFRSRYAGTALGALWAFVQPIVTLLVYVFVFSVGFRSAPVTGVPYVLWLFCAMVPWFFFSDVLTGVTDSLRQYGHLIRKTPFDPYLLPAIRAGGALPAHGVFWGLLLIAAAVSGQKMGIFWLQSLYYSFCALMLSLGLGVLFCALSPFFKDISQTVGILLQVGFWLTPLAWSPQIMSETVQKILRLNPVYYIVQGYRDSFLTPLWVWKRPGWTAYFWGVTALVWILAQGVFKRLRPQFADAL